MIQTEIAEILTEERRRQRQERIEAAAKRREEADVRARLALSSVEKPGDSLREDLLEDD